MSTLATSNHSNTYVYANSVDPNLLPSPSNSIAQSKPSKDDFFKSAEVSTDKSLQQNLKDKLLHPINLILAGGLSIFGFMFGKKNWGLNKGLAVGAGVLGTATLYEASKTYFDYQWAHIKPKSKKENILHEMFKPSSLIENIGISVLLGGLFCLRPMTKYAAIKLERPEEAKVLLKEIHQSMTNGLGLGIALQLALNGWKGATTFESQEVQSKETR